MVLTATGKRDYMVDLVLEACPLGDCVSLAIYSVDAGALFGRQANSVVVYRGPT